MTHRAFARLTAARLANVPHHRASLPCLITAPHSPHPIASRLTAVRLTVDHLPYRSAPRRCAPALRMPVWRAQEQNVTCSSVACPTTAHSLTPRQAATLANAASPVRDCRAGWSRAKVDTIRMASRCSLGSYNTTHTIRPSMQSNSLSHTVFSAVDGRHWTLSGIWREECFLHLASLIADFELETTLLCYYAGPVQLERKASLHRWETLVSKPQVDTT